MQIEHDPKEPKIDRSNIVFYANWAILAAASTALFIGGYDFDWPSVALGGYAMAVLIISVTEMTGNNLPKWWR